MKHYIQQIGEKDCAMACLKMLLAMTYHNDKFLYYPQIEKDVSYSLKDIMNISKNEGVKLSAFRFKHKQDILSAKNFPLLIPIVQNNILHMVLIKKIKKDKVKIYDSKNGIYWLKAKELYEIWNGECLEVEDVKGSNFKLKKESPIPLYQKILIGLFQLLSFVSLITALFFIDEESNFLVPLCLFLSYIILEFVYKKLLVNSMKRFDVDIFEKIYRGSCVDFKEKYEAMNKFKVAFVGNPIIVINSIVFILFGYIILGINSYINVINVTFIILISLAIDYLSYKYFNKKKFNNIEVVEKELINTKRVVGDNFKTKLNKLYSLTYDYLTFQNIKKYIVLFLILVLCLFYCGLSGNISINFLVFHAYIYYFINENASKLFDIFLKFDEYKQEKCLYLYYLQGQNR